MRPLRSPLSPGGARGAQPPHGDHARDAPAQVCQLRPEDRVRNQDPTLLPETVPARHGTAPGPPGLGLAPFFPLSHPPNPIKELSPPFSREDPWQPPSNTGERLSARGTLQGPVASPQMQGWPRTPRLREGR